MGSHHSPSDNFISKDKIESVDWGWLLTFKRLDCKTVQCYFQQYFSYKMAARFIGGGNQKRKLQTCHKSLTGQPQVTDKPATSHWQTSHKSMTDQPQVNDRPATSHWQTSHKSLTDMSQVTERPGTSHWQIWAQNMVSSTPYHSQRIKHTKWEMLGTIFKEVSGFRLKRW
jgi:hypothetical protein